ncbi:MAG: molecular chaperone TorD [Proteobacteria bacterium]|nr:MAG: molecular chaperone TorD [Pseudomonadota bacterium]
MITDAHESVSAQAIVEEDRYRAGAYSLLGALLRAEPDEALLERVRAFAQTVAEGELATALSAVGMAARTVSVDDCRQEFFALFIGIGRGELVPYGSWYLTGFLMERPLGELRADLARLGFVRDESTREPEDHVGALCEVMSMLVQETDSLDRQRKFFSRHMAPWLERFFADLAAAKSASFYRAVARFGTSFSAFEKNYLQMEV